MSARIRSTGDSPLNERDERGSRMSCLERIAAGGVVLAALVALLGIAGCDKPKGSPPPRPSTSVLVGDDNHDGYIDEDESGWDCRTMGNRKCDRRG